MLFLAAVLSGLSLGSMYGLIALGYHITFAVSNTVNFAQGSAVMLGAVTGYIFAFRLGMPMALAVAASLLCCAVAGLAIERLLVRPFAARGSDAWLMATVAGGIFVDNVALFVFGKEPRSFPSALTAKPIDVLGVGLFPLQLVIPVVGLGVATLLWWATNFTRHGKALSAVVQNSEAARLMGINVQLMVSVTYALSTVLAGIAGLLIAPLYNVHSEMGALFGIKAFAVAILGGITHAPSVVAAGLLYGLIEALITAFLGSTYTQILTFAAVILTLATLPRGLFASSLVKKV